MGLIARENGRTREELKAKAPNGLDYRIPQTLHPDDFVEFFSMNRSAPSVMNDYFFLPLTGRDGNSVAGLYWTSNSSATTNETAFVMLVSYII